MKFTGRALLAGIVLAVVCAGMATGQTLGKFIRGTPVVFADHAGGDAQVWFYDGSSHYAKFAVPGLAASYTLTLPVDDGTANQQLTTDGSGVLSWAAAGSGGVTDHGALTGLGDDDHTQYALLAGRAGGQTLTGGDAASESLNLRSTSHATKGEVTIGNASARFDGATGLFITGGAASTERVRMFSAGDSTFRYRVHDDGKMEWSDGSSGSVQTELSHIASGVLGMGTGDAFRASAYLELADNAGIGVPSTGFGRHYAGGALQPGYIQPSGLDRQLQGLVYQAQAASSAITNTTSETSFSIGSFTFPADSLTDGMCIKGRCYVRAATTASPNLTIRVDLDGVTVATLLFASLNLVSATDGYIEYEITVITTGATGTVWGSASGAFNRTLPIVGGSGTAAVGSVDTTGTCLLEVTAQWSAMSASNTITMYPPTTITVSN